MPSIGASGVTGKVSLRSTARPPDSAMLTVICASSGRAARRQLVELDRERRLAGGVGIRQVVELLTDRRHLVVGQAEAIAGKAGTLLGSADRDLAGQLEIGGRRAIEKMSVDAELRRRRARNSLGRRREIELDAVGDIVLDHEGGFADRRTLGIGVGRHAPGAGRGRGDDRHAQRTAAEALIGHKRAAIFDAVGALDHHGQRHVQRRRAARIAQQRGHGDGLAGAIDAAFRIDEGIEPGRDCAGRQRRDRTDRRQAISGSGKRSRSSRSRRSPQARAPPSPRARPASKWMKPLRSVCRTASTSLLRAISRTSTLPRGSAARQRMDKDIDAVMRRIGGEPEIGNDEPLRRLLAVVVGDDVLRLRRHGVDAGAEILDRLVERESGRHFGIELRTRRQVRRSRPWRRARCPVAPPDSGSGCAGSRSREAYRSDCGRRSDRSTASPPGY